MKYIIPILLIIILVISLFFENVFIEPMNNCQLADFPEVYGGDINYVSKSDQKTIIIRDFDRKDYYYKEDEEYIKMAKNKKTTTTKIPIEMSTSDLSMSTNSSNYTTTYSGNSPTRTAFATTFTPTMQTYS
jgi:hypothetical protein